MRPLLPALALLALTSLPAAADTLLRLSESARVMVTPDLLVAELRAEFEAATPAEVQSRVNTLIAHALEQARKVPGVTVTTGSYSVWKMGSPSNRWRGSQSLTLKTKDATPLLTLVGDLQAQGLATDHLTWTLAPETVRKARAQATKEVLGNLRGRAEEAAAILGLRFASFREIRLDGTQPQPRMMPMLAAAPMAASAAPPPPPSAATEDVPVESRVDADVLLTPSP